MVTRKQRQSILRSAGEPQANIRIEILPGIMLAPRTVGESYYWETTGGSRIWHPSAYSKRGWSNMVYRHSTRRVIVGEQWIAYTDPIRRAILDRFSIAA